MPVSQVPGEECPDKDGFTLLFVGRLAPVKNLSFLLRAFHAAIALKPDLRLWIVGDGSERASLEHLARELNIPCQVTFWGEELDVAPFFSAADLFVMSSASEGLPMSLLQALSIGLPEIVTGVAGMAEVVRSANSGIVVSLSDPGGMAAAILELAENHSKRIDLEANAKSAFMSTFGLSHMIAGYEKLYGIVSS